MVTLIRLSSYLVRPNIITLVVLILISGFLLSRLRDSTVNRITVRVNENSKTTLKNDSCSDSNQVSTPSSYICDKLGPLNNHSLILSSYCIKIPIPIDGWTQAEKYKESDIGFLIFTDSNNSHTKTRAMRDTWLSRVTHKYFLNEEPYSQSQNFPLKRIFHGLQIIYNQQSLNPHKWYYIGGCDTFINVPHVLKKLDLYDYSKPLFLGGISHLTTCLDDKEQEHDIEYPSSDAGFFLSSKLVSLIMPQLTDNIKNVDSLSANNSSDIAFACLMYKLGVRLTNLSGYWFPNSDHSSELDGQNDEHEDFEPNNFLSISTDEMYDLDEFYSFLHIDRLVNDRNWKALTDYTRSFISSHYDLLKIKRKSEMSE